MHKLPALVLAAGRGTRMWPLTDTTPKPLLPIAGKPILVHTINALTQHGINEIYVLVPSKESIPAFKDALSKYMDSIRFIVQNDAYGTAAAVLSSEEFLNTSDFLVVPGDCIFSPDAILDIIKSPAGSVLCLPLSNISKNHDISRLGIIVEKDGRVARVNEKGSKTVGGKGGKYINTSIYKFSPSIFDRLRRVEKSKRNEYEITDVLVGMHIVKYTSLWMDIAYPWDLLKANRIILETMHEDYVNADIRHSVIKGKIIAEKDVVIENSVIEGDVYLGKGVKIGPYAYIRGSVAICEGAEVGGGTTVKHSILMRDVKAKHLSYIGDSIIGNNVNFGSGTQIANYRFDGAEVKVYKDGIWMHTGSNKFGTVVGDNTKFGVLSAVMPGKLIGSNCWIGSGVVVGRNIPSNSKIYVRQEHTVIKVK